MIHQLIRPVDNRLVISIPDDFIGKTVEVIAFTISDNIPDEKKYSLENALKFFKKHSVDFSKINKWKREDLYE